MTLHMNCNLGKSPALQWEKKPTNQFNLEGGYASFTLSVKGSGCIRYKWYNPSGEFMPSEISSWIEIFPVTPASFGKYRVVVTNCQEEYLEAEVGLYKEKRYIECLYEPIVRNEPFETKPKLAFIRQPANVTVQAGCPIELSVSVEGVAPKFQWFVYNADKDDPIHGQTKHKLTLEEVYKYNYGTFYVEVTDLFGQRIRSDPAKIQPSLNNA